MSFSGILKDIARHATTAFNQVQQAAQTARTDTAQAGRTIDAAINGIATAVRAVVTQAAERRPPERRPPESLPLSSILGKRRRDVEARDAEAQKAARAHVAHPSASSSSSSSSASSAAAAPAAPEITNVFFERDAPYDIINLIANYAHTPDDAGNIDLISFTTILPQEAAAKVQAAAFGANFNVNSFVAGILRRYSNDLNPLPASVQSALAHPSINSRVTYLPLSVFSINDAQLRSILTRAQQFPNLNNLDISGGHNRGIRDSSIALVAELLPNLHYIDLVDSHDLTSSCVDSLLKMTQLKGLRLKGCWGINQAAQQRLSAKFGPNIFRPY